MFTTTRWHKGFFAALFALLLIGGPGISDANAKGKKNGGVQALTHFQHLYGDLGGAWWEWAFNTGFAGFGEGDVDCSVGQSGKVWFLAGTFGGPAERNCTIKKGKTLLFPLVNTVFYYEEGVDNVVWDLSPEERRITLDGRIGGGSLAAPPAVAALAAFNGDVSTVACHLHATLDGAPLVFTTPIVRGQSGPITISTEAVSPAPGLPDEEAIADGIWSLLKLEKGAHVLTFGGSLCDAADLGAAPFFSTSATYNLTID